MEIKDIIQDKIFTVSEFNDFLNSVLLPMSVTIEGEVSDWRVSQNKFVWFYLKDEQQVLSCFTLVFRIRQPIEEGMKVRATGYPKVYGKSGKFSFVVEKLEISGEGSLKRSFELLRQKLEAEGVFDESRKRPLPRFPETIALITSSQAAAYNDFLKQLNSRWGGVRILFAPVAVQGERAIPEIVAAFDYFNGLKDKPDVMVLTRGGGSLEDMKEFNSEEVVRAVFGSKAPVICGVGHERDTCLAELAADQRAATPTHAAQLAVPDKNQILMELNQLTERSLSSIQTKISDMQFLLQRLTSLLREAVSSRAIKMRRSIDDIGRLFEQQQNKIIQLKKMLAISRQLLVSLSPQSIRKRGYSIVRKSGTIIRSALDVKIGDVLEIEPAQGTITSQVISRHDDKKER